MELFDRSEKISFIPKKPLGTGDSAAVRPMSLLLTISLAIFFIAAASYGTEYFYASALKKRIAQKEAHLEEMRRNFDTSILKKAQNLKLRFAFADRLIKNHISLSSFFDFLSQNTLRSVGYTTFEYKKVEGGEYAVTLMGAAPSYGSLALQNDHFSREIAKEENISGMFAKFAMGDYKLDPLGNVNFSIKATLNPGKLLFTESLEVAERAAPVHADMEPALAPSGTSQPDTGEQTGAES